MKVRFTSKAKSDLYGRWEYVAGFSLGAADRVIAKVLECVRLLGEQPYLGKPGTSDGLRSFTVDGTGLSLFYRVELTCVRIVRILHGAKDWPARFDD